MAKIQLSNSVILSSDSVEKWTNSIDVTNQLADYGTSTSISITGNGYFFTYGNANNTYKVALNGVNIAHWTGIGYCIIPVKSGDTITLTNATPYKSLLYGIRRII